MLRKFRIIPVLMLLALLVSCGSNSELEATTPTEPAVTEPAQTEPATTEPEPTEPEFTKPYTMGFYTLEDLQSYEGFCILYPDGSLDKFSKGSVLDWGNGAPMTYGTDYNPEHILINRADDDANCGRLKNGQLVFFCSEDTAVRSGIYPVDYSGCTISRYNDDGKLEAVFVRQDGATYGWRRGYSIGSPKIDVRVDTINGLPIAEYAPKLEKADTQYYASFPPYSTFLVGVVEGTAIHETEYTSDRNFYFQTDEKYPLKLTPTTDGYAYVDLTDIPDGDYVLKYTYWDEEDGRIAIMTHLPVSHEDS